MAVFSMPRDKKGCIVACLRENRYLWRYLRMSVSQVPPQPTPGNHSTLSNLIPFARIVSGYIYLLDVDLYALQYSLLSSCLVDLQLPKLTIFFKLHNVVLLKTSHLLRLLRSLAYTDARLWRLPGPSSLTVKHFDATIDLHLLESFQVSCID